jgi:hypothetical protein
MNNCVYGCKIIHLSPFIIHQYVSFVRLRKRMRILALDSLSGDFLLHPERSGWKDENRVNDVPKFGR